MVGHVQQPHIQPPDFSVRDGAPAPPPWSHTLCGCRTLEMPCPVTLHWAALLSLLLSSTGGTVRSLTADRYRPSALHSNCRVWECDGRGHALVDVASAGYQCCVSGHSPWTCERKVVAHLAHQEHCVSIYVRQVASTCRSHVCAVAQQWHAPWLVAIHLAACVPSGSRQHPPAAHVTASCQVWPLP